MYSDENLVLDFTNIFQLLQMKQKREIKNNILKYKLSYIVCVLNKNIIIYFFYLKK